MPTDHKRWFAELLHAGMGTNVLAEPDILAHVTPSVMAKAMPRDVMVRVFATGLTSGTMSPVAVVQIATPELMAEHVAPQIVWGCIEATAKRAGILETAKSPTDGASREFLRRGLDAGLRAGVLTPADIVHHVDATVLVHCLPDELTTKLLEASLAAGKLNPELIVETLGLEDLAKHAPTAVVWACFAKAAEAVTGTATTRTPVVTIPASAPSGSAPTKPPPKGAKSAARPAAEIVEEDPTGVIVVELDDSPASALMEIGNESFDDKPPKAAAAAAKPVR